MLARTFQLAHLHALTALVLADERHACLFEARDVRGVHLVAVAMALPDFVRAGVESTDTAPLVRARGEHCRA